METKLLCLEPGCKGEHIQWLFEVLGIKSAALL
jgi:hypothetical protein